MRASGFFHELALNIISYTTATSYVFPPGLLPNITTNLVFSMSEGLLPRQPIPLVGVIWACSDPRSTIIAIMVEITTTAIQNGQ